MIPTYDKKSLLELLSAHEPKRATLTNLADYQINIGVNLWMTNERANRTGSSKVRAAHDIIKFEIEKNKVTAKTIFVESSSGNTGIALAYYCSLLNLPFHCMVDPYINPENERKMSEFKAVVRKILIENDDPLQSRIDAVTQFTLENPTAIWTDQYAHEAVPTAYHSLAKDIYEQCRSLDYILVPVSTGGTARGLIEGFESIGVDVKVVLVDADGSCALGLSKATHRVIPGFGSSRKSNWVDKDSGCLCCIITQREAIEGADYLQKYGISVGGSSGAVFKCCQQLVGKEIPRNSNVVLFFPDGGDRYQDTIYNKNWRQEHNLI